MRGGVREEEDGEGEEVEEEEVDVNTDLLVAAVIGFLSFSV